MDKLTTGDKLVLGGGIVYLIAMFLEWFKYEELGISVTASGWDYFLGGWIPLVLIAVMVAHIGVTTFTDTDVPQLPLPWNQVHRGVGVAAAVIVLLRLIVPSDECAGGFCVDLDRKFGIFVAVIAAICVAAGGSMKLKEDDAAPPATGGDTGSAPF